MGQQLRHNTKVNKSRFMRNILSGIVIGGLLTSLSTANALPNYESKAKELIAKYEFNAENSTCGNVKPMVNLYSTNGRILGASANASGLTEIAAYYKEVLCNTDNPDTAQQDLALDFEILSSGGDGNILWAAGTMSAGTKSIRLKKSTKKFPLRYSFIWSKDDSGQYKISLMTSSFKVDFQK